MKDEKSIRQKVTYLAKTPTDCPICETRFFQETLLTGGGRLIADIVSDTLHRKYRPSKKFGKIHPLIYTVVVCPDCFFSSMQIDFNNVPEEKIDELRKAKHERIEFANKLIGKPVDYSVYRTLETGGVGYALAVHCYDYFTRKHIPVIKQAICSIRAAYIFEDLNEEKPNNYYDFLSEMFYKKALFFYRHAIKLNQSKQQVMETLKIYGPDTDKNYGYDGILYLIGVLNYKYGIKNDTKIRKEELLEARSYLSKLFGYGKSDFEKPKEIVEKSKDFYELISKEIKEIDEI